MMVLRSRCMCALFLTLALTRPTLSCMKCQKEFDSKFLKYKKDLWGKSSWAGDLVFCQGYIDDWMADVRDGWKHDIPKTDIEDIAIDVYDHMDKQYRLSSTRIGYFPKQLQRINKDMKDRLIKAIKDADRKCKQDCNIHPVAMVNCWTCKERTIQCGVDCSVTSFPTSTLPPTTTPAPDDKTTGILITVVVALFAILGGVGYYLYFGKKKKKEASKEGGDGGNDNEEGEENEKSKDDNDDDKSEG